MKKINITLLIILTTIVIIYSHPGRIDKNGGHYNHKTGIYHYHNKKNNTKTTSSTVKYNRSKQFGSWIDADRDGQNTRAEVLIDESLIPVTFKNSNNKIVLFGKWRCPYTGLIFTNAANLDIDHVVPLKEAWVSGASNWTKQKRIQFANYLIYADHLIAVQNRANRSKGAKDPTYWLPSNKKFIVTYLKIWVKIKIIWNLEMDQKEKDVIKKYLGINFMDQKY